MRRAVALVSAAVATAAQNVGTQTSENAPQLQTQQCTKAGGCVGETHPVTIDANWRWTHSTSGTQNCYTGNTWDTSLCPDGKTCAANCAIEGADKEYKGTYGVDAEGNSLKLNFVTQGPYSKNIGSRTFLLEDDTTYKMFKLKNKEFTFDVDVSNLPCGLNGALYFVDMDADGGMSKYSGNKAGAKYGTGYCDAQCPHDIKFINGEANCEDWKPSAKDKNAGVGKYGTCCTEMDIWESNQWASAYTPHACSVKEQTRCTGIDCGDGHGADRFKGVCDKNGCDFQTFRLGDKGFFGPGSNYTVDSTKPVTVVTQFVTADGTDTGDLSEIRRVWVQGGKVIETPKFSVGGEGPYNSISDKFCASELKMFNGGTTFLSKGGLKAMGDAMSDGVVLVMSLWDDHDVNMLWLDSDYPTDQPATKPGVARGPCPTSSGEPADVESNSPNAHVIYSNIRFGEIGSTFSTGPSPGPSPPAPGPSPPTPSGCPGGTLSTCIGLCPSSPAAAYKACVNSCVARCS